MLNRDFKEFAQCLAARGVEYLLVGGYALAAHGHPRYTGDIDFWVNPSEENIARLLQALDDFGFGSLGLKPADFDADTVVQLGHAPSRIDLLTAIDGVAFDDCFARRQQADVGGVELSIIGLDDFIANKRSTGRLKDLADLESLGLPPSPTIPPPAAPT
jgi:predicted nucleotidyltransferase